MASITISDVDDRLRLRLEVRAARHGRSLEEEAREILQQAIGDGVPVANLGQRIHERFAALGGVELELPERKPMRDPSGPT
ncbi:FitA-like ribbon-helix-helix domain-containing protein [Bradyrhizobium sp. HKCCYLR20261]|uniref:FitA-like ribbon-helix-helix domain-containing protein n=1 Tax=unclassified Bradyrhizobium TaxID=2631580 RepID=UPI003EBD75BE